MDPRVLHTLGKCCNTELPPPPPALAGSSTQKSWNSVWLMAAGSAMKSFVQHAEERCHSASHVGPGGFLNLLYLIGMMGSFRGTTASCFPVSFSFWQNKRPDVDCHAWQDDWTACWWSGGGKTRKAPSDVSVSPAWSPSQSQSRGGRTDRWMGRGDQSTWLLLDWGDSFHHQALLGRTRSVSVSEGFACVSLALPPWLLSTKTRSRNPGSSPVKSSAASRQQRTTRCPTSVAQRPWLVSLHQASSHCPSLWDVMGFWMLCSSVHLPSSPCTVPPLAVGIRLTQSAIHYLLLL